MITSATWQSTLSEEKEKPYFKALQAHLEQLRETGTTIYPPKHAIFNAFKYTPLEQLKAVIIGQDPYHGPGQAHGLCFSVSPGIAPPPSLKNIFKALNHDLNITTPQHGCLTAWAQQGILLLNTVLTVEHGKAHSHSQFGWQQFTDKVIETINQHVSRPVVYLLWGSHAIKKSALISNPKHLVLQAPHPSPLSAHRGFLTCQHFSKANAWLQKHGSDVIDWRLA